MKFHNLRLLLGRACLAILFFITVASASFLSEPVVKWTYDLPGSKELGGRSLKKDNAVVVSEYGAIVFVTADDGSLHIITPELDSEAGFQPVVFEPEETPGTYTECRSGVSLYETDTELFAVYAVVDVPITATVSYDDNDGAYNTVDTVTSRIIAVNADGTMRWSVAVNGCVVGTPVVGVGGNTVYVSTNLEKKPGSGQYEGRVRVINISQSGPFLMATKFSTERSAPFGPVGIRTILLNGENVDLVFFAESWGDGFVEDGHVYFLTPSASGQGDDSYNMNTLSEWGKSSVVRPTVSPDGLFLWMGGTGSAVAGWPAIEDMLDTADFSKSFPVGPQWETLIKPSERNETQPLINAPVVSADNQFLYINGVTNELVCLNALDGKEVWVDGVGSSTYMLEPKLSTTEGGTVLYTIEVLSGKVRQHDASDGTRNWEFDCQSMSQISSCQDSVEAEFSISPEGDVLYYGDIFGKIVALQVADTPALTGVPTSAPVLPTAIPSVAAPTSLAPTVAPSPGVGSGGTGVPTTLPTTASPTTASPTTPFPTYGDDFVKTIPPTSVDTEPVKTSAPTVVSGVTATRPPFITGGITGAEPAPPSDDDDNTVLISAVVIVAFAVFAVAGLLFVRKHRRNKAKKEEDSQQEEADRRWKEDQAAWEESCREAELTTISEITSAVPPKKTPPKRKSRRKTMPRTPATLASIAEGDDERSTATDRSRKSKPKEPNDDEKSETAPPIPPVNLDYRFAATTPAGDENVRPKPVVEAGAVVTVTPVSSFDDSTDGTATSLYIEDDQLDSPLTDASHEDIEMSLLGNRDSNESPTPSIEIGESTAMPSSEDPASSINNAANLDLPDIDEPGRILPKNDGTFDDPGVIPPVPVSSARFFPAESREGRSHRGRSKSRSKSPVPPSVSRLRASWNKSRAKLKREARSTKSNPETRLGNQALSTDGSSVTSATSDPFHNLGGQTSEETSAVSPPSAGSPTSSDPPLAAEKQREPEPTRPSPSNRQSFFESSLNDIMETIAKAESVFFKPATNQSESSGVYDSETTSKSSITGQPILRPIISHDDCSSSSFDSTDSDSIPPPPPPPLP